MFTKYPVSQLNYNLFSFLFFKRIFNLIANLSVFRSSLVSPFGGSNICLDSVQDSPNCVLFGRISLIQHLCARDHVFILRLSLIWTKSSTISLVEKVHHPATIGTIHHLRPLRNSIHEVPGRLSGEILVIHYFTTTIDFLLPILQLLQTILCEQEANNCWDTKSTGSEQQCLGQQKTTLKCT